MLDVLVIGVLSLFFAKFKHTVVAKQRWRESDAVQRQRTVRDECAFRVVGRLVTACSLVICAFTVVSPGLGVMWVLVALRIVKPIGAEMRDACNYRSTGSDDEAPYSW
jgi:hypothetical protein